MGAAFWIFAIFQALLISCVYGLLIAGLWRVFEKAGKPGWASLIPIYNTWVLVEIIKKPVLWFIMLLLPCVSAVFAILVCIELAKVFGKSAGYGIGLVLLSPVFFPMLGLGPAQYHPELANVPSGGGGGGRRRARYEDEEEEEEEEPPPRRPRR